MSRPIYTPELHTKLVNALLAGTVWRHACEAAGLRWVTWKKWLRCYRKNEPLPPGVRELVRDAVEAHAKSSVALTAAVSLAAKKDWRAALGLLEFRATAERRRLDLARAAAELKITKARLAGTLPPERHEHTVDVVDDLRSRIARLASEDEARSAPRDPERG